MDMKNIIRAWRVEWKPLWLCLPACLYLKGKVQYSICHLQHMDFGEKSVLGLHWDRDLQGPAFTPHLTISLVLIFFACFEQSVRHSGHCCGQWSITQQVCSFHVQSNLQHKTAKYTFLTTQVLMQHPFAFICHIKTNCPSGCCPDLHVEKSALKIRQKCSLIPLLQTITSPALRLYIELNVLEDQLSLNFFSNVIKQCYLNIGEPRGTYRTCKHVLPVLN